MILSKMNNNNKLLQKLIVDFIREKDFSQDKLEAYKRDLAKKTGYMPKNSKVLKVYRDMVKNAQIEESQQMENLLRLKSIRSLSGIVPIAVLTKPYPCPGNCVYCPTQKNMPKSYLDDEPAVMRADMAGFDPHLQVTRRLEQLQATGHDTEKIELIVMGGTFTYLPWDYQKDFLKRCFDAANQKDSDSLKEAKKINETAKNRIIGVTLETRPDEINPETIKQMRELGGTRVEIGVQSIYNDVLKKVNRGHGVEESIEATKLLKEAGFKICYHLMPNLPGSSLKKDLNMFETVFNDEQFMPDMIKIYSTVVTYQAELYEWFKQGKFKPYNDQELIKLIAKIKEKTIPEWVRINRLGRDIPAGNIAAGTKISNIRQVVQERLKKENLKCQCIRCREIRKKYNPEEKIEFKQTVYTASGGEEYFLQYVNNKDQLYALLRLRITEQIKENKKHFISELQDAAIIRELHTYGLALPIETKRKQSPQHKGLGRKLIKKAEEIVKNQGINKIAVISGIGVREYYKKLGYKQKGTYMVKEL